MKRQMAFLGVWALLLCLWTSVAHAITVNITDDTYSQQESPNTTSGSATSLSVSNVTGNQEHITYALFDVADLLASNVNIDRVVLRIFVNSVSTGGNINVYAVTSGSVNEQTLTWNTAPTLAS